jgi:4-coumarate--CoA ligase
MIRGSLRKFVRIDSSFSRNLKFALRGISSNSNNFQQQEKFNVREKDIIVKSPYPDLGIPELTIDQFVWRNVSKWGNKVAVVDGITDRQFTYFELRDKCRILAIKLQNTFNLNQGDTLAICLPNTVEFPLITLSSLECGIIATTINPIYTAGDV